MLRSRNIFVVTVLLTNSKISMSNKGEGRHKLYSFPRVYVSDNGPKYGLTIDLNKQRCNIYKRINLIIKAMNKKFENGHQKTFLIQPVHTLKGFPIILTMNNLNFYSISKFNYPTVYVCVKGLRHEHLCTRLKAQSHKKRLANLVEF